MTEIKNISDESMDLQAITSSRFLWIVVASLPVLFHLPSSEIPIWALGLAAGGWIANKHPLRWIAIAWLISVFFPQMPFLLLACSGVLLKNWRDCLFAALLGSGLYLIPMPDAFLNTGLVLIIVGLISITYKSIK